MNEHHRVENDVKLTQPTFQRCAFDTLVEENTLLVEAVGNHEAISRELDVSLHYVDCLGPSIIN